MSGFTGNDGSELVGGLTPSGAIKALSVDANGNIILSQLPGATALADGMSNPTTGQIGANLLVWDGSNWDRALAASYNADGNSANDRGLVTKSTLFVFNGTNWDRWRGDNTGAARVSLYGKNAAAGDTPIAVDSSGRVITLDSIRALILNGQCFNGTTGKLTAPTANVSHSLFNPNASGKLLVVFMARLSIANGGFHTLNLTTTDPALGNNSQVNNMNQNSATTSVASCTYINTSHTADGTEIDGVQAPSGTAVDFLNPDNGALFVLKASTGLEINVTGTTGNLWQSVFRWAEI